MNIYTIYQLCWLWCFISKGISYVFLDHFDTPCIYVQVWKRCWLSQAFKPTLDFGLQVLDWALTDHLLGADLAPAAADYGRWIHGTVVHESFGRWTAWCCQGVWEETQHHCCGASASGSCGANIQCWRQSVQRSCVRTRIGWTRWFWDAEVSSPFWTPGEHVLAALPNMVRQRHVGR